MIAYSSFSWAGAFAAFCCARKASIPWPTASTSARSCNRPAASLLVIRSAAEIIGTRKPASLISSVTACAGGGKLHAVDARQDFDHDRRSAHAKAVARLRKVILGYVAHRRAEFRECAPHGARVLGVAADKDIEVLRRARLRVNHDGIPADQELVDAFIVEI